MWLSIALVAQLVLLALAGRRKFPWRLGGSCRACSAADIWSFCRHLLRRSAEHDSHHAGYWPPGHDSWLHRPVAGRAVLPGDNEILNKAIENRKKTSDKLTPLEAPLAVQDRLVIIQAESLCCEVIGYQCEVRDADGKTQKVPVTPFLNQLRDVSRYLSHPGHAR